MYSRIQSNTVEYNRIQSNTVKYSQPECPCMWWKSLGCCKASTKWALLSISPNTVNTYRKYSQIQSNTVKNTVKYSQSECPCMRWKSLGCCKASTKWALLSPNTVNTVNCMYSRIQSNTVKYSQTYKKSQIQYVKIYGQIQSTRVSVYAMEESGMLQSIH